MAGLVAAATGAGLISAARKGAHGMVIPALHNAADDRPTGYTPVCGQAVVPVCVHPAFRADLRAVMAAVGPVFDQVAGLPGAPVRVTQIQTGYFLEENGFGDADMRAGTETISGNPPVLFLPLADLPEMSWAAGATDVTAVSTTMLRSQIAPAVVTNVIGGRPGRQGGPAQQAIETALLMVSGTPRTPTCSYGACAMAKRPPAAGTPIYAAARRFAALPAATRHAWLQTHLAALRAGHLTLGQLP